MKTPWKSPTFYLGLGASFMAIGVAIDSKYAVFGLAPQFISDYIAWFCLSLFAISLVLFLIAAVGWFRTLDYILLFRVRLGEWILGGKNSSIRYSVYQANQQDVNKIFKLCIDTIGIGVSRPRKMKAWLRHNDQVFYKLIPIADEEKDMSRNIHGYFCLIPLNSRAVQHLENHELDGASFTPEHICKPNGRASAWYIGGVAGKNQYSKNCAMRRLKRSIQNAVRKEGYLYTRPVTEEGLKWVSKFGFESLEDGGQPEIDELCKMKVSPEILISDKLNKALQRTGH